MPWPVLWSSLSLESLICQILTVRIVLNSSYGLLSSLRLLQVPETYFPFVVYVSCFLSSKFLKEKWAYIRNINVWVLLLFCNECFKAAVRSIYLGPKGNITHIWMGWGEDNWMMKCALGNNGSKKTMPEWCPQWRGKSQTLNKGC